MSDGVSRRAISEFSCQVRRRRRPGALRRFHGLSQLLSHRRGWPGVCRRRSRRRARPPAPNIQHPRGTHCAGYRPAVSGERTVLNRVDGARLSRARRPGTDRTSAATSWRPGAPQGSQLALPSRLVRRIGLKCVLGREPIAELVEQGLGAEPEIQVLGPDTQRSASARVSCESSRREPVTPLLRCLDLVRKRVGLRKVRACHSGGRAPTGQAALVPRLRVSVGGRRAVYGVTQRG